MPAVRPSVENEPQGKSKVSTSSSPNLPPPERMRPGIEQVPQWRFEAAATSVGSSTVRSRVQRTTTGGTR